METTPDLCGWQNLDGFDLGAQDETDWLWRSGDAGREEGGPATDHTLEIGAGHYLLLPTTGPARLLSRPLLPNTSYCLELQATLRPPATLLLTYRDIRTGAEEPGVTWRGGAAGWTRLQLQLTPRQDTFWLEYKSSNEVFLFLIWKKFGFCVIALIREVLTLFLFVSYIITFIRNVSM